jgi:hypothetical protein
VSLRFDPTEGLIVVPTRLTGPSGSIITRLALDTGSTASIVSWDLVVLLGYDPAVASERVRMTTGSGIEFAPRITVERIEALEQERREHPILCHSLPPSATVDGVLGLDFFRGQRLIVDLRAGLVTLE